MRTITVDPRPRRSVVSAAALSGLLALTGCSGSSAPAATRSGGTSPTAASPTADAAAASALSQALTATKALRSYAFRATQRLSGGAAVQQTTVTGRAVRPSAVSYDLSVAGKHQLVIKINKRTYVRVPPAAWKALAKPGATVDPVAPLLPLLNGFTAPVLSGRTLRGTVSSAVLTGAGLAPAGAAAAAPTPVTLTLGPGGHVASVALRLTVKAGARTLVLDELTSFSQFDAAPAIKAPGAVK